SVPLSWSHHISASLGSSSAQPIRVGSLRQGGGLMPLGLHRSRNGTKCVTSRENLAGSLRNKDLKRVRSYWKSIDPSHRLRPEEYMSRHGGLPPLNVHG